ncbi:ribonuclease H-like domain-containing protein, partial [Aspergillus ambiguus]|uniref:putative RNA exonuclease n=1 Tax=Aspergillus ambiguus TaxID=176160 RepID=UPI003CCC99AF
MQMASPTRTPRNRRLFTCPCCLTSIKCIKALREHQNILDHKLPCAECPRKFVDSAALEQHSSEVHRKSAKPQRKARFGTPATGQPSSVMRFHDFTATLLSVTDSLNAAAVDDETSIISFGQRQSHRPPTILEPTIGIPATGQPSSATRPHRSNDTLLSIIGKTLLGICMSSYILSRDSGWVIRRFLWQHQHRHPLTMLDPAEQAIIFQALRASCHPPDRRQAQGYMMLSPPLHDTKRAPRSSIQIRDFRETPGSDLGQLPEKRQAIVIDCEMVEVEGRRNELASLSAIDFLTGEVLIDNLVCPVSTVTDWRSDVSGVKPDAMELAVATNQALYGWQEARQALWIHADSETVFVGHSLNHDLDVLGILHHRVVDSSILTSQATFPECPPNRPLKRLWALKKLTKAFLGCDIHTSLEGHSSLEDAFATREVVLCCLRNPGLLRTWADDAGKEWVAEKERNKERRRRGRKTKCTYI